MDEPPIPVTGHWGAPDSYINVFLDTSLDTHLALDMVVSPSNTVADLKKKILDKHPLCFPKFGEIKIDALKVKKRGVYYNLAESILLKSVFDGVKKGWFVSVEASIVSKDNEIEPKEAKFALVTMNNGFEDKVAGGVQLVGGDVRGDKVFSLVPLISDESLREKKCDEEEAQEMHVERAEMGKELANIDAGSILPERASGVKENHEKRKRSKKGADKREKRKRSKKGADDLSGKDVDVSMHKFGPKSELVVGNVQISDQNVAGIQTGGVISLAEESEAQVVHVEFSKDGSKGSIVNEIEENLHHLHVANKRLKTGKEIDDEASLRDSSTIVLEFSGMTCKRPVLSQLSTVDEQQNVVSTLKIPNAGSVEAFDQLASRSLVKKKRKTKSSKKVDRKTAGLTPDEANAGKEIHLKEAGIDSGNVLHPSAVSLTKKDPDPPQEQHNIILSQEAHHVTDYYATDIPSREAEKVCKAESSIHEASKKGDVKEAATANSLRASLLVTNKEIEEVINNVMESAQPTKKSEAVVENEEGKPRKKTKKKHGADEQAEIRSLSDKVVSDTENAREVDGVNFRSYFIPKDQSQKTADPSEVTGAWSQMKSKEKREVKVVNLHEISPKLPGPPTSKEELEAQAIPQEKKPEPSSSAKGDNRKPHCEATQESSAPTRQNSVKPKKAIEHHHSDSPTNTSHIKSGSLSKSNSSGDGLERYHFPYPLNQSPATSPGTHPDLSVSPVYSDGESGAVFDSMKRNGISGQEGMKTSFSSGIPLDTTPESTKKRYKKAKLDVESQYEDLVPLSPSI
ncbi:unnamed protein product [Linum tenue]|uniref:Uncharacterized protein n=1 Tax=Linum tenue TaxID=586396 RepID=A0AAV0L032_9ROSI|nr:unnamed protein product [Linum tenue]